MFFSCIAPERTPAPSDQISTPHQKAVTKPNGRSHGTHIYPALMFQECSWERKRTALQEMVELVNSEFVSRRFNYTLTTLLHSG
jgi:hypothetical protein